MKISTKANWSSSSSSASTARTVSFAATEHDVLEVDQLDTSVDSADGVQLNSPLKANSGIGSTIKKVSPVTGAAGTEEARMAYDRLLREAAVSMFDDDEDGADAMPIHVPLQLQKEICMETPTHHNVGASSSSTASPNTSSLNTPSISRLESEHTDMSPDANANSGNSHRDTFNDYSNHTPHPTKGRDSSGLDLRDSEEDLGVSSTARNILDAHLSSIDSGSGSSSPSGQYNEMHDKHKKHEKDASPTTDTAHHKRNLSLHHSGTHSHTRDHNEPHYMLVTDESSHRQLDHHIRVAEDAHFNEGIKDKHCHTTGTDESEHHIKNVAFGSTSTSPDQKYNINDNIDNIAVVNLPPPPTTTTTHEEKEIQQDQIHDEVYVYMPPPVTAAPVPNANKAGIHTSTLADADKILHQYAVALLDIEANFSDIFNKLDQVDDTTTPSTTNTASISNKINSPEDGKRFALQLETYSSNDAEAKVLQKHEALMRDGLFSSEFLMGQLI